MKFHRIWLLILGMSLGMNLGWCPQGRAELFKKDVFICMSQVPGFEVFRILEWTEADEGSVDVRFVVLAGNEFFPEIWTQVGKTGLNPQNFILFEGLFTHRSNHPESGAQGQDDLIYISINREGRGSLSVQGELDPLGCQKAP
jgi:hypothetical protein